VNQWPKLRRLEAARKCDRAAGLQRRADCAPRIAVKEWRHRENDVVLIDTERIEKVLPGSAGAAVLEQHALRVASSSRRVQQGRLVLGGERNSRRTRVAARAQRVEGDGAVDPRKSRERRAIGQGDVGGAQVWQVVVIGDDQARLGVPEDVTDLGATQACIDGVVDRAGFEGPEGGQQVVDRVAHGDGDPVAAAHPELEERVRGLIGQDVELAVRDAPSLVKKEGMIAPRPGTLGYQLSDQHGVVSQTIVS
jgi:hypothetical protein